MEIVLRALHLYVVALTVWLPACCIGLDLFRKYDAETLGAQRRLIRIATLGLIFGALSGLLYGWLEWSPSFHRAILAVGSRLPFAIVEFTFSLVLYAGYWLSLFVPFGWRIKPRLQNGLKQNVGVASYRLRLLRAAILFVGLTNLAYHFPNLLNVIHQARAIGLATPMTSAQFRSMAFSSPVLVDTAHFLLGSVIVGSHLAIGLFRRDGVSERFLRWLAACSIIAIFGQWLTGLAAFSYLSRSTQLAQIGGAGLGGWIPMIIAVWLLTASQLGLVFRPRSRELFWTSAVCLSFILLQMSWMNAR